MGRTSSKEDEQGQTARSAANASPQTGLLSGERITCRLWSNPGQAPENRAQQVVVGRASVCVCMSVGASTCVCVRVRGWCDYVRALAPQNSLLMHQKAQTYHVG